jgi:dihydroorotase
MGSSTVLPAPPAFPAAAPNLTKRSEGPALYDLLIQGGRVIDPSQGVEAVMDVAVTSGKIARLGFGIPASDAERVISAHGKIVTPGLIDIHTHVFPWVGPYGISADPHCIHRGVTTVVDAGTAGALTFPAFRKYDIERAATRILALLHVVSIGMVAGSTPRMGELEDLRYCAPELAVECASQNRDVIVGFKIRFSRQYTGPNDIKGMKRARRAADEAGLPLMCHIAGPHSPLHEFLSLMRRGDIWTHCFNDRPHGILDANGQVKDEVREARQRGVRFDVGHGAGSFSFEVARKCIEQGFPPDTISTDLYSANVRGPVYGMPETVSKFLLLGMSFPEIVKRTTQNAVETFKFQEEIGTLKTGAEADVSVFEIEEADFAFTDSYGNTRLGRQRVVPVVTIRGGKVFYPTSETPSLTRNSRS